MTVGGAARRWSTSTPRAARAWDGFLDGLAEGHTVYAPDHPGTGETAREAIYASASSGTSCSSTTSCSTSSGLATAPLVGSSFGGMVACELAALRRDAGPQARAARPDRSLARRRARRSIHAPVAGRAAADAVRTTSTPSRCRSSSRCPTDPEELAAAIADTVWALGSTGKFVWPIPDKGLKKRLHRVAAPTLIIWGEHDRLVSAVYAEEFAAHIAGARVEIIAGAGHVPQWEQPETVKPLVLDFLGA